MAKKPKKRGPKPGPKEEFRSYRLQIRLNESERKVLDKAAGEQETSTWLRELGLRAAAAKK